MLDYQVLAQARDVPQLKHLTYITCYNPEQFVHGYQPSPAVETTVTQISIATLKQSNYHLQILQCTINITPSTNNGMQ